jgi:HD-GYP domain-containing protein (c-di-GMP phosphodiesterase class II)
MKNYTTKAILNFVRHLMTAISTASLYYPEHQQVERLGGLTLSCLLEAMGEKQDISLVVIDNELIMDGSPLESGMYVIRLIQTLASRGVGHVKILHGVTLQDIMHVVKSLSKQNTGGEINSTNNVRFGKVEVRFSFKAKDGAEINTNSETQAQKDSISDNIHKFTEICEGIKKNNKIEMAGIMGIVTGYIALVKHVADPLFALAPHRNTDEYTFIHSTNICILNLAQANALGIEGPLLYDIGIAALLHDVGKLFIPEELLNKPGSLNEAEWKIVRQHPFRGAQYLLDTPGVPHLAVITAYEHHMNYDFSGYPDATVHCQQNLSSQMTTVSDFFDALRTNRPYQEAMTMEEIPEFMLKMAGKVLHPALTRNFLKIISGLS